MRKLSGALLGILGGRHASALNITVQEYADATCSRHATVCGADADVAADGSPCAGSGMIRVPADTIYWNSGECMPCPSNPDQWGYPFFFCNGTDDQVSQTLLAQRISPRYTKVSCAVDGAGATIEHFSDATCTAANKVSGIELDMALMVALWSSNAEMPTLTLANISARVEMPGLEQCLRPNITAGTGFSDMSVVDNHCTHLTVTAYDEACVATTINGMLVSRGVLYHTALEESSELARAIADEHSRAVAINFRLTGCDTHELERSDDIELTVRKSWQSWALIHWALGDNLMPIIGGIVILICLLSCCGDCCGDCRGNLCEALRACTRSVSKRVSETIRSYPAAKVLLTLGGWLVPKRLTEDYAYGVIRDCGTWPIVGGPVAAAMLLVYATVHLLRMSFGTCWIRFSQLFPMGTQVAKVAVSGAVLGMQQPAEPTATSVGRAHLQSQLESKQEQELDIESAATVSAATASAEDKVALERSSDNGAESVMGVPEPELEPEPEPEPEPEQLMPIPPLDLWKVRTEKMEKAQRKLRKYDGQIERLYAHIHAAVAVEHHSDAKDLQAKLSSIQSKREVFNAKFVAWQAKNVTCADKKEDEERQPMNEEIRPAVGSSAWHLDVPTYWRNTDPEAPVEILDNSRYMIPIIQQAMEKSNHQARRYFKCDCHNRQNAKITAVHRVENMSLWRNYQSCKQNLQHRLRQSATAITQLDAQEYSVEHAHRFQWTRTGRHTLPPGRILDSSVNEFMLWHGTTHQAAETIAQTGFDERRAQRSGLYGCGSYFADAMCKSSQYATENDKGEYCMLYCRVAMGAPFCTGTSHQGERHPPENRYDPRGDGATFDSIFAGNGVANRGKQVHNEFVCFRDYQIYPEYIVKFVRA